MSDFIPDFNMASEKIQSPVRYPSNLIDEEWEILEPILQELEPYTTGRPRTTDLREILNAIFYLNKQVVRGAIYQKTFLPTRLLTITTINGPTIAHWKKSMRCFVSIYAKKRPKPRPDGSDH